MVFSCGELPSCLRLISKTPVTTAVQHTGENCLRTGQASAELSRWDPDNLLASREGSEEDYLLVRAPKVLCCKVVSRHRLVTPA